MKRFEIHLGCIYQHSNGSICCVENIVGEDIFVNSTSGELWCFANELRPIELDKEIIEFMPTIAENVNFLTIFIENKLISVIMQNINSDAIIDNIFYPKYVHEVQLFIQLSKNIDIHEKLFKYLLTR